MNPRLSLPSNKSHPSAGSAHRASCPTLRPIGATAPPDDQDDSPGVRQHRACRRAVHARRNPAGIQILAASARASSSIRGGTASLIMDPQMTRGRCRAGPAPGRRRWRRRGAWTTAIDARRKKNIEDLNAVMGVTVEWGGFRGHLRSRTNSSCGRTVKRQDDDHLVGRPGGRDGRTWVNGPIRFSGSLPTTGFNV